MATASAQARGTSVVSTTGTTWATTANAFDGAVGTNPATYATWVNAASAAVGTIVIGGYTFPDVGLGATINSVTANIRHIESNTTNISTVTVQLQDSTGTAIGSAVSATKSTSAHSNSLTVGTPTLAQVQAGLRIAVTVTRGANTTSTTFSLDQVDVTVNFTVPSFSNLTDDFASKNTTKWHWTTGASVVSGQASLAYNNGADTSGQLVSSLYDLTDTFVSMQLADPGFNTNISASIGLYLSTAVDANRSGVVTPYVAIWESNGTVTAAYIDATSTTTTYGTVTYNSAVHKYIRIRHSSALTLLLFEWSTDGLVWTNMGSTAPPIAITALYANPAAYDNTGARTPNALIDNFNILPSAPKMATLLEDFASQDTTKWRYNPPSSVTTGQLSLGYGPDGTTAGQITSRSVFDLTDSTFLAQATDVLAVANATTDLTITGINICTEIDQNHDSAGNFLELNFWNNPGVEGLVIEAGYVTAAGVRTEYATTPYDSVNHKWLRIRHSVSANLVYFDTSPDGKTWNNLVSHAPPALLYGYTKVYALVGAYSVNPVTPNAKWDNVNLPPSPPVGKQLSVLTAVRRAANW